MNMKINNCRIRNRFVVAGMVFIAFLLLGCTNDDTDPILIDENDTGSADSMYEEFLNNELPVMIDHENEEYSFYYEHFEKNWDYYEGYTPEFIRLDFDNDGQNELAWNELFYGTTIIDARDNNLYILAEGGGTTDVCSYTFYNNEVWIVYSDTTHTGREKYYFHKFNGNGEIVDSFNLSAEYWDEPDDRYNESSDFTYRDEKISMQEFENIRMKYLGY